MHRHGTLTGLTGKIRIRPAWMEKSPADGEIPESKAWCFVWWCDYETEKSRIQADTQALYT
jgi:hypothetical protein